MTSYKNSIYYSDLQYIFNNLAPAEKEKLEDASFLITGCAGFLGFYLLSFLNEFSSSLRIRKIIGIDNFRLGTPIWINELKKNSIVEIYDADISKLELLDTNRIKNIDYIIHMASIASPTYYRKYPIETIDANVWGLRALIDFYKDKDINGFLFFSSSEVYGDPMPDFIPTPETYRGNVEMIGPRACYDESKRFGETIGYLYAEQYGMPITIVRPFNNYGPGMKLDDKRVPADFAKAIIENEKITIYSDGTPTRTFCYIADAIVGYLKALLYGSFNYFNIGIDNPEISVVQLAEIYKKSGSELVGYNNSIEYKTPDEQGYLTHVPLRRCPDISKARLLLHYAPSITVQQGVHRFLSFIKDGGCLH